MGATMPISQLFFSFSGRINRAPFWAATITLIVLSALGTMLEAPLSRELGDIAVVAFATCFALAQIVSTFAITAKRLHDCDLSGWWMMVGYVLFPVLITYYIFSDFILFKIRVLAVLLWIANVGYFLWLFIQTGFLRGTVRTQPVWPRSS